MEFSGSLPQPEPLSIREYTLDWYCSKGYPNGSAYRTVLICLSASITSASVTLTTKNGRIPSSTTRISETSTSEEELRLTTDIILAGVCLLATCHNGA